MKSLTNRIDIYHDESIDGFICRLATVNHVEVKDLGLRLIRHDAYPEEIEEFLFQISKLSDREITSQHLVPYQWFLKGFTLPEWKRFLYSRFCPMCLSEQSYHRAHWCLAHYTFCPRHKVFLIEKCLYCTKKLQIHDVTKGICTRCGVTLKISYSEIVDDGILYIQEDGTFKPLDSPCLRHYLNQEEQLELTKWLSYHVVENTDYFSIGLEALEKKRLASFGYYSDPKKQFKFMSVAHELLDAWPADLISFWSKHQKKGLKYPNTSIPDLIYRMRNQKIKEVLLKTYRRDSNYSHLVENRELLKNYLYIDDLIEIYKINIQHLHNIIGSLKFPIVYYPRTQKKMIHDSYIPLIHAELKKYKGDEEEYISLDEAALIWGVSILTTFIVCELLHVKTITLLDDEICYFLPQILEYKNRAGHYVTTDDLEPENIWSGKTLKWYLKNKRVPEIFHSKLKSGVSLYNKEDALKILQTLSNNKGDYITRYKAIEHLGYDLFKAGQLDQYYPKGAEEIKPYFLKEDINKISVLFRELGDIKKVEIFRLHEKMRNNM